MSLQKKIISLEDEIEHLRNKLNETITMLNFISMYYESNGDYAGCLLEVE